MHEAAWVAAGNTEKYNGQNLEAYDEKIKELESGRLKYEKALNVLEYTMDHTDLLSDPLDDPLLLHVEVWKYLAMLIAIHMLRLHWLQELIGINHLKDHNMKCKH
jgi:hypothetical protein